jgi:pilus assembly protein CpaE
MSRLNDHSEPSDRAEAQHTINVHDIVAPVPRVTIQAFCETHDVAAQVQDAFADRRLNKAQTKLQMGGPAAALEAFRNAPTPNVIILESVNEPSVLVGHLEGLSDVCDEGTRLIIIGHRNDILLYRDLIRRGVSDYIVAPVDVLDVVKSISGLYGAHQTTSVGRVISVVGAKGGVGASTIAHNLAWSISQNLDANTVIVDLDIPFGTAGLDFNQDPPQGIAEAVFSPDRVDGNFVDRLLSRCSDRLTLLAAPALLDRTVDIEETGMEAILEHLRQTVPFVVLDVPHVWQAWTKRSLVSSDEVVIVAGPDLASLRNTKNLVDLLRSARPNDSLPRIVLNQVGLPKRPEIAPSEFPKALKLELTSLIPFEAQLFGTAANNGQMIAEIQAKGKITDLFGEMASIVTGKADVKRAGRGLLDPIMSRLMKLRAS